MVFLLVHYMSVTLLFLSILNVGVFLGTYYVLKNRAGAVPFLPYYRGHLRNFFQFHFSLNPLLAFLNLASLHLLIPLMGLAFLLKSDFNFMAVLIGIIVSMQITQRLYPTHPIEGDESNGTL